jgi:hypothetical protein
VPSPVKKASAAVEWRIFTVPSVIVCVPAGLEPV